jgi:hypothetical protein
VVKMPGGKGVAAVERSFGRAEWAASEIFEIDRYIEQDIFHDF